MDELYIVYVAIWPCFAIIDFNQQARRIILRSFIKKNSAYFDEDRLIDK